MRILNVECVKSPDSKAFVVGKQYEVEIGCYNDYTVKGENGYKYNLNRKLEHSQSLSFKYREIKNENS